jgi:DNA-binding SARP family transcriptional activator/Tfp pilus assembly protein PilF
LAVILTCQAHLAHWALVSGAAATDARLASSDGRGSPGFMAGEVVAADREMEFCLLGPLQVLRRGAAVPVPSGLQRSLLAVLLLRSNMVVPVDDVAEALWGPEPPQSARASLHNVVMRLRQSLADAGHCRVIARPGGYQIRVEPGELDVERFETLVASGLDASRAGLHAAAAARLRAALSLWRGQPLAGVRSDLLAMQEGPRLEEMRLQALEARIDADLRLGRGAEAIIELRQLAAVHPLRERLHALLMIALYEAGQQAEALAVYQFARSVLVRELGTEPGPALRQVQQRVLAGGPAITDTRPDGVTAGAPSSRSTAREQVDAVMPRQLPAAAPHFVGRNAELAALAGMLNQVGLGATVVISAVAGMAGVGKTALALHWASHAADQFPDGQLYVDLRGFGPSGSPMRPAAAIRMFLDALGVPHSRLPVDLDAQAALYRSLLAGKRMLIVLDNARDPAQVRLLLPGSPTCLVLVTSRNQLTGLAATAGARLLTLDALTEPDARQMLALRLGPGRASAEPGAVTELIQLCARLPLALSIAAALAAATPRRPLAALVTDLRDARARLDMLGTGDAATDMRSVFSWSYQQLSAPTARMFRLLSLHPGPDITIPAAASLAGVSVPRARHALAGLARAHLLTEHVPGRYACHDLLRAYSAELAHLHDNASDRQAALHRVLDHYLHTAYAASMLLCFRDPVSLSVPQAGVEPEQFTDGQQALPWLKAERQVLLGAVTLAADNGFGVHAWQLPWTLATFLDQFGYWHELVGTQQVALTAATQQADRAGQAQAHRHLARGQIRLGNDVAATAHLTDAIELAAQSGDDITQAVAHHDIAGVLAAQGRVGSALSHIEQSRRLYSRAGHRWGEANALSAIGWLHSQTGNYRDALDLCSRAMSTFRELGIKLSQSATLDTLGYAHHQLGQYAEAIACFEEAIACDGDAGEQRVRAEVFIHLGDSHQQAGNTEQARGAWLQALALLEQLEQLDTNRVHSRLGSN